MRIDTRTRIAGLAVACAAMTAAGVADARPAVPAPTRPPTLSREAPKPPWRRRRRTRVKGLFPKDGGLVDLSRWPLEPVVAAPYDEGRFIRALQTLCGPERVTDRDARRFAGWILESAEEFGVDPFTLGAIVYRQSRCDPKAEGDFGLGLTRIHARMHGEHIVRRQGARAYRYYVLADGQWQERFLPLDTYRFTRGGLLMAKRNLYFAAALLSVAKAQCPDNDGVFGSVPHRHPVSHFYWGDRVRGAGAEDRTLQSRRRLIEYYAGDPPTAKARFEGHRLMSPLDGGPRKVTSEMGAQRAGGKRSHAGIDFESVHGEPVRAIAAGHVAIAGLDRPRGGSISLKPENAQRVRKSRMGPGGLYVMVNHGEGLQSAYMHLAGYRVRTGQRVEAGEIIGWVGRTGIKRSGAHLHFELRKDHKHIDPLPVMRPHLFELQATWRGRRVVIEERRQRKRRRRAARKAAREARRKAREAAHSGTH